MMKQKNENERNFFLTAGIVFGIVGILHLYRAIAGLTFVIENFSVPIWLSAVAGIVILGLSFWAFKLSKK